MNGPYRRVKWVVPLADCSQLAELPNWELAKALVVMC